jgi:hypothetical protein
MILTAPLPLGEPDLFVIATNENPIDDSDICLAISKNLEKNEESGYELNARIAQVGFQIAQTRLRIMNIQGAGPKEKLLRAGVDRKKLYEKVHKKTHLKPMNALLGVVADYAQLNGFKTLDWNGSNAQFHHYPTILNALQFREHKPRFFELDLVAVNRKKILSRVTGADPEKIGNYQTLYSVFEPLLERLI